MSNEYHIEVAEKYAAIDKMAKSLGSPLHAPFMTLPEIPALKLSDRRLFDGDKFQFASVFR